jgi:hypothetical protein
MHDMDLDDNAHSPDQEKDDPAPTVPSTVQTGFNNY